MDTPNTPTKDRILQAALALFSRHGFDAVSVDQIAAEVGIKAPSLYKHFKGKRDIFDAIFAEMQRRYDEQAARQRLHMADAGADAARFAAIDADGLARELLALVTYSLRDPYVAQFRRLLTIEQFRAPRLAEMYTERYVERLVGYHQRLFEGLVAAGAMRGGDSRSMALQYTSPVLVLLGVCDRQPEREAEALAQIEAHAREFYRLYHTNN